MKRKAVILNDFQVAKVVKRGDSVILTLLQEEMIDYENGSLLPAKSLSISDTDAIVALRDLLNSIDFEEGGERLGT